ncbi:lantibiotic dehydratase [Actinomadura sp. LD22]|uniref:Lantibiotic dehydratase n=1 Tax=Actinomadura physcomitrii TaxID=2650748 RepID=A0A6I4M4G5_9ACTN|nr:lantibiotic dehydratase [Actinomadura physcomitrii]MVZ99056.1 lantibiotic dehydratase [Actinomadura physcomitrii]
MARKPPFSYQWQPGVLLRATTAPDGIGDLLATLDDFDDPEQGRDWLAEVWRDGRARDALEVASPVLVARVQDVLEGRCRQQRRVRRVVLSVASYLLRWQRRPTPFGLFAGVAPAHVGDTARVSWGTKHLTAVRPDADWLADIIDRLHHCPELLRRLPVVANDTAQVRGDRLVILGDSSEQLAPLETSVRLTRPLEAALETARRPVRFGVLRDRLAAEFSSAAVGRIEAMLTGLVSQNVLISSLRAPMTQPDALGHLCRELRGANADTIDLVQRLYELNEELGIDAPPTPWRAHAQLAERMRTLSAAAPVPLIVDTALDCQVQIPEQVAREAHDAAGVLYRLTPQPFGYQHWRDYHGRFRERYGAGAVVPLTELVADSELGLPAGYLGSAHGRPRRPLTDRDEKLLALVQQALLDGDDEIVLTEQLIEDLAVGDGDDIIPVPRAELAVEIHARSVEALTRGSFRLVVTGTPRPGSSMAGRFAHLLPQADRSDLEATYRAGVPEAISAQLSFAPRRRRNENISRTPQLLPYVIVLSEHRADRACVIGLDDLAVTADARQFFLIQLSTGRRVEPRVVHALEAGVHTPPLARFIAEITTARCAVYKAFDFGAAAHLPYLPRVRYRRTILAPARWLLTASDLPGRHATMAEWEAELRTWQARLRVGDRVTMVDDGQRLPLDLGHRVHRALLRTRLDSTRQLELREAPSPDDLGWIGKRAHELLFPLALAEGTTAQPAVLVRRSASPIGIEAHLPGRSNVLCADINAHPMRYNDILTTHLPNLLQILAPQPQWWFRRHRRMAHPEDDQYLALYLQLTDAAMYGRVAAAVHDWAADLHRRRLLADISFTTYRPQTGRYGHGSAMHAAHAVFATDSSAALAQLNAANRSGIEPQVLAAVSMIDLALSFTASPGQCFDWLIQHLPRDAGPIDRSLAQQCHDLAAALTEPDADAAAIRPLPGGPDLISAWTARRIALTNYRAALKSQRDPLTVLRSLLHLHHVRAVGVDPDLERLTGHLVRSAALRRISMAGSAR